MRINNLQRIYTLAFTSILINTVSAFSAEFFSPGFSATAGSRVMVIFKDYPARVNVKFAVQNPDNSLTSIESSALLNLVPSSFTEVRIADSIEPGINYWLVAIDAANSEVYTTYGPFSIYKMFDKTNPTASITVSSGETYATGGASLPTPTSLTGSSTPSGFSSKPTSPPSSTSNPKASNTGESLPKSTTTKSNSDEPVLSTGAIIGIAAGGGVALFTLVALIFYRCCFKKAVKALIPIASSAVKKPSDHLNDNSSTIPMTTSNITTPPANVNNSSNTNTVQQTQTTSPQTPTPSLPSATNNSASEYTFNVNSESTYNYQHPANYPPQQGYSSYPYPYNPSQQNMSYYPAHHHDSMPVPELHYGGENNVCPPLSPTLNNSNYNYQASYQQQFSPTYPPQQVWGNQLPGQFNAAGNYSPYPPTTNKIEAEGSNNNESVLSQKVEYNGIITADNKAEYHQKPDTTTEYHHQKPDTTVDEQYVYSKPNQKPFEKF